MTFRQLDLAASLHICLNMRAQDQQCLNSLMGDTAPQSFAINRWQTDGAAWAFYQDGVPVVMGGIQQPTAWLGVAWMVSTDCVTRDSWRKIIRFSRTVFANARKSLQRIDAYTLDNWPDAVKYADRVGFQQVNVRKNAGREGQNVLEFAIMGSAE